MVVVECFDLKFDGGLYGGLAVVAMAHNGSNGGHRGSFSGNEGLCGSSHLPACSFTNTSPATALAQTVPSNLSSLPEAPVMSQAKGKLPLKKGLSTGVIVAVVIVGLL
nr:leucine-rich repeat receptor-like protein kinase pxc1 [Quercus suber]